MKEKTIDFKAKRRFKKMSNLFYGLAYGTTALFILFFIVTVILNLTLPKPVPEYVGSVLFMIIVAMFPTIAFLFFIIGSGYKTRRLAYMSNIYWFRQYKYFHDGLKATTEGNFERAMFILNNLLKDNTLWHKYFYFLTSELSHSDDEKYRKLGIKYIALIIDKADPSEMKPNTYI